MAAPEIVSPARPQWAQFGHRPALDGVRAIAVIAVVLFHTDMPGFANGYAGVDVFFVLSGFLITSLIAREVWSTRRLDVWSFYARRMRRLLPAALLVLLVTAVLYQMWANPIDVAENRMSFVAAALYFSNWFFLARSQDYFAEEVDPSPVLHFWSLSVEEQFYIFWPWIALTLLIVTFTRKRLAVPVVGALAAVSIATLLVMAASDPSGAYFSTFTRAYQLLIGAALALFVLRGDMHDHRPRVSATGARSLAWVSAAVLIAVCTDLASPLSAAYVGLVAAFASMGLIAGLEYSRTSGLARGLSSPVARALGRWSYSIYLWHWPIIVLAAIIGVLPEPWWLRVPAVLFLAIFLAWITWSGLESRFMAIDLSRASNRNKVVGLGLVAVLATAVAMPLIMRVSPETVQLIDVATDEQGFEESVTPLPGSEDEGARILLVGDSHAGHWAPALKQLAADQGWHLVRVTSEGCPWPFIQSLNKSETQVEDCDARLREPALKAAADFRPDITILAARSVLVHGVSIDGEVVSPQGPVWAADVDRGSREFLSRLKPLTGGIVILEPVPETTVSMNECLAQDVDPSSCAAPAVYPPGAEELRQVWTALGAESGATLVDVGRLICPDGVCPAAVDGVVTHRDAHHLTSQFAVLMAQELDRLLLEQGISLQEGKMPGSAARTAS